MLMSRRIRRPLILVDGVDALTAADCEVLASAGLAHPEHVASLGQAAARVAERPGSMVIVPMNRPSAELDAFGEALRAHPDVHAIAIAPARDADLVLTALRAGVQEFLVAPLQIAEVQSALDRMNARAVPEISGSRPSRGQVITVHAAKGGVGTSTIAASLACALAERSVRRESSSPTPSRVVLVDFTTSGAGLRVMLNVEPTNDLSQVLQRVQSPADGLTSSSAATRIDYQFLQSLLHDHHGVALLAAGMADAPESLDAETASQLIRLLRQGFEYVVIDTDQYLTEQTLAALDAADHRLLVTTPEIMALRSVQQAVALGRRLGYDEETVQVVMNRVTDRDRLSASDAQRVVGCPIVAQLPNAYRECHAAIAAGSFVPRHVRNSTLAAGFFRLAAAMTGEAALPHPGRPGRGLGRLFRRGVHA
jgi:pilus assembly protein CpaE